MKKSTPKSKGVQGCLKISSFFTKPGESGKSLKSPKKNRIPNVTSVISKEVINIDSEDEESESLLSKRRYNKRPCEDREAGVSPPMKKSTNPNEESPQPSTSGLTECSKKSDMQVLETPCMAPSTSGGTPVKIRPFINVKTPEKLLSPAALRELHSPARKRNICKELTPVKATSLNTVKNIDNKQELTPEKQGSINKSSTKRSSGRKNSGTETTPSKTKKTPKKLFEKSPTNLSEFNVEVLRNFVRITPSKKEVEDNDERRKKSVKVQLQNEKTPVKDLIPSLIPSTSYSSPASKVRAKLDFASCSSSTVVSAQTSSDKNCSKNTQALVDESAAKISEKENHDINNLSFTFDEDSWDIDIIEQIDYNLDLTKSQHCKIVNINQSARETIVTVKSTQTNEQALCTLQGFWMHSSLCIGDTVNLMAKKASDTWLINNEVGFLVFEPDFLISTTTVVNSVFCKRRTVFQERFRGFEPTNKFMIVGSMVHSLLQDVLRNKFYQPKQIEKCAIEILNRKQWVRQIYESGESLAFIAEEFMNYIPKIHDFIEMYVEQAIPILKSRKPFKKDDWKGTISAIEDIEENIWCPDLGVKGKVDVSIKNGLVIMPLEIKTGRASVSLEHRAQVLLYIMMMTKLGYRVSSGLLLYLKEGILREIPSSAAEKRDIIILRNELAYFLTRTPKVEKTPEGQYLEPGEVPEPIDHPSCSRCPYNSICMAYSKYLNEDVSSKKSLMQVHNQLTNFLTSAHIDYFMHWASLLSIEMSERNGAKDLRDIYTLPPEVRKNKGKCLIDLALAKVNEELNGTCLTTFKPKQHDSGQTSNFLLSGFAENSYVVVSVKNRPAVASGFVTFISMESVIVSLDRNLSKKYKNEVFFLDSYDSTAFLNYNLASLALLLDTTERGNQLRSIVVDKRPATFQPKLPRVLADKAKPILKRLNRVQQRAVLKAIAANEYFLIKGMPGTGKTVTIVALVQLLLEMGKSVLITSHTHSAVDTVCLKLKAFDVKFMRLGSQAKMDPSLAEFSEHSLIKDCSTPEALERVYNSVQVLAVTCLGSGHAALSKRTMDVCIVDESTQVLQCAVFRPLHAANTFILIGDPDQLPTVVRNRTATELGMGESLFERLDSEESRVSLNLNYRMNEPITALANVLTYNGELQIGAERIAKASLNVPKLSHLVEVHADQTWLVRALDTNIENSVQFIDTGSVWNLNKTVAWAQKNIYQEDSQSQEVKKCVNIFEAAIVYRLVKALITEGGVAPDQIGVICTYRIQVALLAQLLKSFNVDVNTVDQFQGKDNEIIIYSCSKSTDLSKPWNDNKFDLTEDKRRLNVAITRAKHKLIMVGDLATLLKYSTFKKIKDVLEKNVIKLLDTNDFEWDNVLDLKL